MLTDVPPLCLGSAASGAGGTEPGERGSRGALPRPRNGARGGERGLRSPSACPSHPPCAAEPGTRMCLPGDGSPAWGATAEPCTPPRAEPRRQTPGEGQTPSDSSLPPRAAGLERRGAFLLPGRRRSATPPRLSSANGERLPSFILLCNGKCRSEISVCERFSEKTNIFIGTGQPANQAQNCWLLWLP